MSSDPAAGARVEGAPLRSVELRFTEQPEIALSDIQVLSSDGTRVDDGHLRAGSQPRSLAIVIERQIPNGTYTVAWHCVSKVDGHATAGAFAFGVGVSPKAPIKKIPTGPPPNALEMIGRFFFLVGVAVAFGAAVVAMFAFREAQARMRGTIAIACVVALAGVAVLAIGQHNAVHASWSAFLDVPIGHALIERAVAVGFALLFAVTIGDRTPVGVPTIALFTALAMAIEVHAGHAAGAPAPAIETVAQVVHFAAAAVWMGGLAALLVAIRGANSDAKSDAILRYSRFAAVSLFVVAATGTYRAYEQIGALSGLFHSSYGQLVIAKVVLLVILAGLGARQRFWNLPKIRTHLTGLRRIGKEELAVATVVFVATAMLTGFSPPPPAAPGSGPLKADGTDLGHTVKAHLEVAPGQAGVDTFTVKLDTAVRPQTVSLRFSYESGSGIGPSTLRLRNHGGVWSASAANLSLNGRWMITVLVQAATTSAEVPLQVATPCKTDAVPGGKGPTVYSQTIAGGDSASMYLDPGKKGKNEVHFTYFDAKGNELNVVETPTISSWRPDGAARQLAPRRFSKGHFIATARLDRGNWRFESEVVPAGATQSVLACFEQKI